LKNVNRGNAEWMCILCISNAIVIAIPQCDGSTGAISCTITAIGSFFIPTLIGNIIGGVALVAALNYARSPWMSKPQRCGFHLRLPGVRDTSIKDSMRERRQTDRIVAFVMAGGDGKRLLPPTGRITR